MRPCTFHQATWVAVIPKSVTKERESRPTSKLKASNLMKKILRSSMDSTAINAISFKSYETILISSISQSSDKHWNSSYFRDSIPVL